MFSLAVLIGRGLDHSSLVQVFESSILNLYSVFSVLAKGILANGKSRKRRGHRSAPLAQLVEHLTLNQGVPGSSP